MIYLTPYDPVTLLAGESSDSGFQSLDQVVELMGPPAHRSPTWMTYPDGIAFSQFVFRLTAPSAGDYAAANRIECSP